MVPGRKEIEKLNPENPAPVYWKPWYTLATPVFLRLFKDCKIGWWTSIILTVVFTSVYIYIYIYIYVYIKWQ